MRVSRVKTKSREVRIVPLRGSNFRALRGTDKIGQPFGRKARNHRRLATRLRGNGRPREPTSVSKTVDELTRGSKWDRMERRLEKAAPGRGEGAGTGKSIWFAAATCERRLNTVLDATCENQRDFSAGASSSMQQPESSLSSRRLATSPTGSSTPRSTLVSLAVLLTFNCPPSCVQHAHAAIIFVKLHRVKVEFHVARGKPRQNDANNFMENLEIVVSKRVIILPPRTPILAACFPRGSRIVRQ